MHPETKAGLKLAGETLAASGWRIASRTFGYGGVGLALTVALGLWALPDIAAAIRAEDERTTAVQVALAASALALLAGPVLWIWLGWRQGLQGALAIVFDRARDLVLAQVLDAFMAWARPRLAAVPGAEQAGRAKDLLAEYLGKLDGLPRIVRWLGRGLVQRIDPTGFVAAAIAEHGADAFDPATVARAATAKIAFNPFAPSLVLPILLFALHTGAAILGRSLAG